MKKRYGKFYLVIIIALVALAFTWIYPNVTCGDVCTIANETTRAGIMDFFTMAFYSFYYRLNEIFYIFAIGGCYGVLHRTKAYRKMVDKVANFVRGKEIISTLVLTLVMGLYTAFCDQMLVLLAFIPFIITVYLRAGRDRITSILAAFGGMFIGSAGALLGTNGMARLMVSVGLEVNSGILYKIVFFIASYVLFNLFTWLHIRKQTKLVDSTKYDLFNIEELDESDLKPYKRTKVWPTAIVLGIFVVLALISFVNWKESFNVSVFNDALVNFKAKADVLYHILGDVEAFGNWTYITLSGMMIIFTLIISAMSKRTKYFLHDFGYGMKRISRVAIMYGLLHIIFMISYVYGWAFNPVVKLLSGKYGLFRLYFAALLISLLAIDPELIIYVLGLHMVSLYEEKLLGLSLIFNAGFSLVQVIAPTSVVLMIALTYLDVPYTKWVKEIWKYALSLLVVSLIILALV